MFLLLRMGSDPDQFRPHRHVRARCAARVAAFTLVEALVASVIVAMVALAASTSVAVGIAVEEDNRRAVLATQLAELRMSEVLEQPFESMAALAGTASGASLGSPPVPGSGARVPLPGAASGFSVPVSSAVKAAWNGSPSSREKCSKAQRRASVMAISP